MAGEWGRPRPGAARMVDRFQHWRNLPGHALTNLVENSHWAEQHTAVHNGRKPGVTNFAVEFARRHELTVWSLGTTVWLQQLLQRIMQKEAVESVSVHHG